MLEEESSSEEDAAELAQRHLGFAQNSQEKAIIEEDDKAYDHAYSAFYSFMMSLHFSSLINHQTKINYDELGYGLAWCYANGVSGYLDKEALALFKNSNVKIILKAIASEEKKLPDNYGRSEAEKNIEEYISLQYSAEAEEKTETLPEKSREQAFKELGDMYLKQYKKDKGNEKLALGKAVVFYEAALPEIEAEKKLIKCRKYMKSPSDVTPSHSSSEFTSTDESPLANKFSAKSSDASQTVNRNMLFSHFPESSDDNDSRKPLLWNTKNNTENSEEKEGQSCCCVM
jgi:hypothetical protein